MLSQFVFVRIFGHEGSAADDIIYVNWLNMVRAGLLALEFYTPDTQAWKQVKESYFAYDTTDNMC